jgi:hypothetical protein
MLLLFLHIFILFGLWSSPAEYPYVDKNDKTNSNKLGKTM